MSFWEDKKVLVTGGAGLIGSYTVELLVEEGAQVRVVDNLSRGTLRNLEAVERLIDFGDADLRLLPVAIEACRGQDVVMHLASPSYGVEFSGTHHGKMLTDVATMGMNVLEACRLAKVERTLVVSSSCVYPDEATVPTAEGWGRRGTPEYANQGYGWGKRVLELQAEYYQNEYQMDIRVARPFNTYGPRVPVYGDGRDQFLVALIYRALMNPDKPLVVWGDGEQKRALMHAKVLADLLLRITAKKNWQDICPVPINAGYDYAQSMSWIAATIILTLWGATREIQHDLSKPTGAAVKMPDSRLLNKVFRGDLPNNVGLTYGIMDMCRYVREEIERKKDQ